MSEKLLDRALQRTQESNDRALARAADAESRLTQAQDLLTALGIPLSTDPAEDVRVRAPMSSLYSSTPRKLTLTERILIACGRVSLGVDMNVPSDPPVTLDQQYSEAPRGGLYRTSRED